VCELGLDAKSKHGRVSLSAVGVRLTGPLSLPGAGSGEVLLLPSVPGTVPLILDSFLCQELAQERSYSFPQYKVLCL
jgi:hypothetical protein